MYLDPPVRLVWERGGVRRLPPGTYRVRHYVIERAGWMLSCSGDDLPVVTVEPGKETVIAIDPRLNLECEAQRTWSGWKFSVALTGHAGMEASLLDVDRGAVDRRSPARFRVLDRDRRELAAGPMRYG